MGFDMTKGVPVLLDRERYLFFSRNQAREAMKLMDALGQGSTDDLLDGIVKLVTLGLKRETPDITEEQVGDLVGMHQVREIQQSLLWALTGKPSGVGDDPTVPLAPGGPTSENSNPGPSPATILN